jgi:hypothetical protein
MSFPKYVQHASPAQREQLTRSILKILALRAPQNDDELWMLIGARLGFWLPRRAVCPNHDAPFQWVADAYFERYDRLFAMAAKGTGKTRNFAIVHELNSQFKPGTWTAHVGAIEKQARRCYDYLDEQLKNEQLVGRDVERFLWQVAVDKNPLRSLIPWRNASRIEISSGTLNSVSGMHPAKGGMDEVELSNAEVFNHFSKALKAQENSRAQLMLGSTRFKRHGLVDRLLAEKGSVFHTVRWCVYDAMAPCPHRCDKVDSPVVPPSYQGRCPLYSRQEKQADGTEREVLMCGGKAHYATGHLGYDETVSAFLMSDAVDWGVIMELARPGAEGMFLAEFDDEDEGRHVKRAYEFDPTLAVYLGYDHGFGYPAALGAWQVRGDGFLYQFDEIYVERHKPSQIFELLAAKPWFRSIEEGWPDPTAQGAIQEYRDLFTEHLGKPVMHWHVMTARKEGWRALRYRLGNSIVPPTVGWHPRCTHTIADLAGLQRSPTDLEDCKKEHDHGADQARYLIRNLEQKLRTEHRPEGDYESSRQGVHQARDERTEARIRILWDQARQLGVPQPKLVALEADVAKVLGVSETRAREQLARNLGDLVASLTMQGRLDRGGIAPIRSLDEAEDQALEDED